MCTLSRILVISLVGMAAFSCQSSVDLTRTTLPAEQQPQPPLDSASLAYELSQKTWCSNDEAFSLLLLLVAGEDRCLDFNERLIELKVKGLADPSWKSITELPQSQGMGQAVREIFTHRFKADDPITKGTLAYLVCRAANLKTGLMMYLLPSRRYAYREAVYHGLLMPGSVNEPLTAPEVVGIMGRVARLNEK